MTARLAGFDTRAEIGMRAPTSVSRNIQPSRGGAAVHYGGGGTTGIVLATPHDACRRLWRAWQNYHMDSQHWADIAYTGGYCPHGIAMAGRGLGVRTAANGTADANDRYHAFVYLGNADDPVTAPALDALDWWLHEARTAGGGGMDVVPHSALYSTSCPGNVLRAHAVLRDDRAIPLPSAPVPAPTPPPVNPPLTPKRTPRAVGVLGRGSTGALVSILQRMLGVTPDGIYGDNTAAAVLRFQRSSSALGDDELAGPATQRALLATFGLLNRGDNNPGVRLVQWIGNVAADGDFGPATHTAVVQMQAWAGLEQDGIVGPGTRAKIVR